MSALERASALRSIVLIAELTAAQEVGAWFFDPAAGTLAPGTVLSLEFPEGGKAYARRQPLGGRRMVKKKSQNQ